MLIFISGENRQKKKNMYRKKSKGWYKHKDFILIDLICIILSFLLADWVRNSTIKNLYQNEIYRNTAIFLVLMDLCVCVIFESYKGVLRRGYYLEFNAVIKQTIILELGAGLYLFSIDGGHFFSRIVLYLMGAFYIGLAYLTRLFWKKHLKIKMAEGGEHSLYIITTTDIASDVIASVLENNYNRYNINGLVLTDCDMTGQQINGIPVVSDMEYAATYICQKWVDEVLINISEKNEYPQKLIDELLEMGMVVHLNLSRIKPTTGQKQFVEMVGGYTVLTTTMNYATDRQALAKRIMDIAGGLVGCLLTGIIFVFVGPAIYINSPGPVFFSQIRIGKNGKPFKMYKFRSMYMDAEERKAELMRLGKVDREGVEMIKHYKESPLVQKAMDDVEKYFARKQELTKRAEQVVGDKPIQKENVSHPKSRKESVLQALRERQAKIKEQEQTATKEKSRTHKKGEVSL